MLSSDWLHKDLLYKTRDKKGIICTGLNHQRVKVLNFQSQSLIDLFCFEHFVMVRIFLAILD